MNEATLSRDALARLRHVLRWPLRLALAGALLWLLWPFAIVPPGHRGVMTTLGKPSDEVYSEGIHWRLPLIQAPSSG